jgi:hypothetical protein
MPTEVSIVIGLIIAGVTAYIAEQRGRNPLGWFVLGWLCCCIAIPALFVLPNLKEAEALELKNTEDKRRLQEQLRQEQLKLRAFQRITNERIDHHDGVLGLDTKAGVPPQVALPGGAPSQLAPPPLPVGQTTEPSPPIWHYALASVQYGPVTADQLIDLLTARSITRDTLIWNSEMKGWLPMKDSPEFRNYH